jgi:hypothetical protein
MTILARRGARPGSTSRRAACAVIALAAVFASTPSRATPTTVTLDLSSLATGAFTGPVYLDGFTLTPQLGVSSTPQIANVGGTYVLESTSNIGSAGADTYLTMTNGGTFSMVSVEVAALGGDTGTFGIAVASTSGGAESLARYGSRFGVPLSTSFTFETLSDYSGLSNVTTIDLDPVSDNGDNFAVTAITVSYTQVDAPEPAAIGLFSVGLAGLAMARLRHVRRIDAAV